MGPYKPTPLERMAATVTAEQATGHKEIPHAPWLCAYDSPSRPRKPQATASGPKSPTKPTETNAQDQAAFSVTPAPSNASSTMPNTRGPTKAARKPTSE